MHMSMQMHIYIYYVYMYLIASGRPPPHYLGPLPSSRTRLPFRAAWATYKSLQSNRTRLPFG